MKSARDPLILRRSSWRREECERFSRRLKVKRERGERRSEKGGDLGARERERERERRERLCLIQDLAKLLTHKSQLVSIRIKFTYVDQVFISLMQSC